MAVAATHLTTAASDTDAASYTTASITPVSGRLVAAWVSNEVASGTPTIPTLSGNGLNYVQVATVTVGQTRLTLFRALGLGPVAGTVTIDFGGVTQIGASWSLASFAGVNPGGTDGSAAIVQAVTNSNTGTSITATLAAFADSGNATAGGFRHSLAENATAGTGFAVLGQASGAAPARNTATEFRTTTDTTVDATWASSAANLAIAIELSAASSGLRTAPTIVVDAPEREPWTTGLIPTARALGRLVTHSDDRFLGGLGFSPRSCDPLETFALCSTVSLGATPTRDPNRVFDPFVVVAADICSPIAWRINDGQGRAMEQMLTLGSKPIEAELWTGALTGNPHLGAPTTTIVLSGAQTPAAGLAGLEQAIANGSAGSGVIYARPALVDAWADAQVVFRDADDDGVIRTVNGTPVVSGSGFPGTGPNGEAVSATSEWAYATDLFEVHVGPTLPQSDTLNQSVDFTTNTMAVREEMGAVAIWGGCLTAAVQINPTVSDEGALTDAQLRANPVPISGAVTTNGLTDTQLRSAPVPVSGTVTTTGLTDTQLRATPVPVSGPLTDSQLRATPVPVSGTVATGGLTDTQLRASAVPVSAASLPLPTGAATAAKQPALGTAGTPSTDVISIQGVASGTVVPVVQSPSGALTDRSGTLTAGGVAQNAMPANATRRYLLLRNPLSATEPLWYDLTATAVAASPSIRLDAGDSFVMESGFVSNQALSVFAATTGHAWTAKEG